MNNMVNKKVLAGTVVLGTAAGLAYALTKAEAGEEGAPRGEVSIKVVAITLPTGYSMGDVKGAWGTGVAIDVSGLCSAGTPAPTMVLELYDNDVLRKTLTPSSVALGTYYTLSETMGVADLGSHTVYGRMVLTNELGSYEFITASESFDIGEPPTGQITTDVTLS